MLKRYLKDDAGGKDGFQREVAVLEELQRYTNRTGQPMRGFPEAVSIIEGPGHMEILMLPLGDNIDQILKSNGGRFSEITALKIIS